jgi:hypothetical protein
VYYPQCFTQSAGKTGRKGGYCFGYVFGYAWVWFSLLTHPRKENEMNRSPIHNHNLPAPDNRGRIRPYVGQLPDGTPTRFQVGDRKTTPVEAERRLALIRSLYEKQCERFGVSYWMEWCKQVALKIGMGRPVIDCCIGDADNPRHLAGVVSQLRAWGIPIIVERPDSLATGLAIHNDEIASLVQRMVMDEMERLKGERGAIVQTSIIPQDPLALTETATLYQVLDAYSKHLAETGATDQSGRLRAGVRTNQRRIKYLKEHLKENIPLWKMDLPHLEKLCAYWRNRPLTRKETRTSVEHIKDMMKELSRFLGWLDNHPNYKWEKPKGWNKIDRSPIRLPEDNGKEVFRTNHKETYTPEQLAMIVQHAEPMGKAIIGVCVNCAFGAAEVGQFPITGYSLNLEHPHADKIGIISTDKDSWIVGMRLKANVYGEHLLWEEVAEVVKPLLDGREVLPVSRTGKPWFHPYAGNPQTAFTNWWKGLIARVRKTNPDFP